MRHLSGVGALWDNVLHVCSGGGGCASGGVPLGGLCARTVLMCREVSFRGAHGIIIIIISKASAWDIRDSSSCSSDDRGGGDDGDGRVHVAPFSGPCGSAEMWLLLAHVWLCEDL